MSFFLLFLSDQIFSGKIKVEFKPVPPIDQKVALEAFRRLATLSNNVVIM